MTVLLDSHTFIWWLSSDDRLSGIALQAIQSDNVLVSAVTAYELCFKSAHGRLPVLDDLDKRFQHLCDEQGFELLSISVRHALEAARFPTSHRDPFDRLLAAQSKIENIPLVTIDPAFHQFDCQTIW